MREQRRVLRKRRRNNQIIRRCTLMMLVVIVAVLGIKEIAAGKRSRTNQLEKATEEQEEDNHDSLEETKAAKEKEDNICIVLDAGHGGKDPGTLWETSEKTIYEKDINLMIVKKLKALLEDAGYRVVMTRTEDERIVLKERVQIAKEEGADVFVSVHQNALENDTVTQGIQVYSCQESNPDSGRLADSIHSHLLAETGAEDKGVTKDSDFFVLLHNTMPACLVETGFITSEAERLRLLDETYQQKLAQGIAEGVMEFLGQ